jgi:transcriptional regulator of acetoin/glycerol metabolism
MNGTARKDWAAERARKRDVISVLKPDGLAKTLDDVEWETVVLALRRNGGDVSMMCRELELGRSTYYRWLKRRSLDEDHWR